MKYYATIEGKEYVIEIGPDELKVNDETFPYDFHELSKTGFVSLILNNRSLEAIVEDQDGISNVLISGELYEVKVQDERGLSSGKGSRNDQGCNRKCND